MRKLQDGSVRAIPPFRRSASDMADSNNPQRVGASAACLRPADLQTSPAAGLFVGLKYSDRTIRNEERKVYPRKLGLLELEY